MFFCQVDGIGGIMGKASYRRVLLKLSGQVLAGTQGHGIDPHVLDYLSQEIASVRKLDVDIGIVIGGGNILRGQKASKQGLDRVTSDYMGMLATVINAMALQDVLEKNGLVTRAQTAIPMERVAEPFIRRRAIRHLEKGRVVIFGAGTGNPYFTTDTAAALRAIEIGADVLLKGTKVDGVYNVDPEKGGEVQMYRELTHKEFLDQELRVMDVTAISLCMENHLPIIVFNIKKPGNLKRVVMGEPLGTMVCSK